MSDIWSTFPWDLIPDSLKAEETRAFSTAMGNAFHRMLPYTGRVSGHASIDMLPDEILDLLAVELRTAVLQGRSSAGYKKGADPADYSMVYAGRDPVRDPGVSGYCV